MTNPADNEVTRQIDEAARAWSCVETDEMPAASPTWRNTCPYALALN